MNLATQHDPGDFAPAKENGYNCAKRFARYYSDASTVRSFALLEHDHVPPLATIQRMIDDLGKAKAKTYRGQQAVAQDDDEADEFVQVAFKKERERAENVIRTQRELQTARIFETPAEKAVRIVAATFNMTPAELKGPKRHKDYIHARATVCKVLRELHWPSGAYRYSHPMLAKVIGRNDHSTTINAIANFDIYARRDERVTMACEAFRTAFKAAANDAA